MSQAAALQTAHAKPQSASGQSALLQRKCACGSSAGLSSDCEECGKKKLLGIQTKLAISEPGDAYEREADRIADQVLAMPSRPTTQAAPLQVQRFAGHAADGAETAPAIVDRTLAGFGKPLEPRLREDMEGRFGHDFSRVRVHTDAAAERSARAVNAHAYTVGRNIVFGAGKFVPGTQEGRRLVAHELAHTIQQRGAVVRLARKPAGTVAESREEMEVVEGPKSTDPSAGRWFVYRPPDAKSDRRSELPPGTRVVKTGKPQIAVLQGQGDTKIRRVWQPVRVLAMPAGATDTDGVVGKSGSIQALYLAPMAPKAPAASQPAPKRSAPAARFGAEEFEKKVASQRNRLAAQEALERREYGEGAPGRTVAHIQNLHRGGAFGTAGGGGALQITALAIAEPVKEGLLAAHAEREKIAKEIENNPAVKFVGGVIDGVRENLDLKVFASNADTFAKLAALWHFDAALQLEFYRGTAEGAWKEIEGLIELLGNLGEVKDQIIALAKAIVSEGGGELAESIGYQIGSEFAKRMTEMGGITDANKLSRALGETFGPVLLEVAIGFVTGGSSAAASVGKRLSSILARFPKLLDVVEKLADLRKARKALPDSPKAKDGPNIPKTPRSKRKRPPPDEAKKLRENINNMDILEENSEFFEKYDVEIETEPGGPVYRRSRKDGTWCRFNSPQDCDHDLGDELKEHANRKAKDAEYAKAAGIASEIRFMQAKGFELPDNPYFPGIDGWKGGKRSPLKGKQGVIGATVAQKKNLQSLRLDSVEEAFKKGVGGDKYSDKRKKRIGLLDDPWEDKRWRVVSPKERILYMIFDEETYSVLGPGMQRDQLLRKMRQLSFEAGKNGIEVRWMYRSYSKEFDIIIEP